MSNQNFNVEEEYNKQKIHLAFYKQLKNITSTYWLRKIFEMGKHFHEVPVLISDWDSFKSKNPSINNMNLYSIKMIQNRKCIRSHIHPDENLIHSWYSFVSTENLKIKRNLLFKQSVNVNQDTSLVACMLPYYHRIKSQENTPTKKQMPVPHISSNDKYLSLCTNVQKPSEPLYFENNTYGCYVPNPKSMLKPQSFFHGAPLKHSKITTIPFKGYLDII